MTVFDTGLPVESILGELENALNNHRNAKQKSLFRLI